MNALKIYLNSPNERGLSELIDKERAKVRRLNLHQKTKL